MVRRRLEKFRAREAVGVTVCIAAIGEQNNLFLASDRMVTTGDIEFEPQQPKIYQLSTSIAVMTAGDIALQTEILQGVYAKVRARIETEPKNWWNLADVTDLYVLPTRERGLDGQSAPSCSP